MVAEGGLRLGRRWRWLEGAPARVRVIGSRQGVTAKINGEETELDADGFLPTDSMKKQGEYVVEIGNRLRRKVNVDAACVHPDCVAWPEPDESRTPIGLPQGDWTVVGTKPRECQTVRAGETGELVRPAFKAEWAIRVGARRGSTAIHLHDPQDAPADKESFAKNSRSPRRHPPEGIAGRWAETIYQAAIRKAPSAVRPRMLDGGAHRRVAGSREAGSSTQTRNEETATVNADRLLEWMTHVGSGPWDAFRDAVDEVDDVIEREDPHAWYRTLRIAMSDLGHVDFFVGGSRRWQVRRPVLAGLADDESAHLFTGGRTSELLDKLEQRVTGNRNGIVTIHEDGPGPSRVKVTGEPEFLREVAEELRIQYLPKASVTLAGAATSIRDRSQEHRPRRGADQLGRHLVVVSRSAMGGGTRRSDHPGIQQSSRNASVPAECRSRRLTSRSREAHWHVLRRSD